jgi:spermidine synthase
VTIAGCRAIQRLQTRFQEIALMDIPGLGETIFIDGYPQISQCDQYRFNEIIIHSSLCATPHPRRVFIAGVASGGNVREALRHPGVETVIAADIDQEAIELFQGSLSYWNAGALSDPRVTLQFMDARDSLAESAGDFDAIVIDLPDPLPGKATRRLFTREFCQVAREKLSAHGVIMTQAGRLRLNALQYHADVATTYRSVFQSTIVLNAYIACYYEPWAFLLGSPRMDLESLGPKLIDARLQARGIADLQFYSGEAHAAMQFMPKEILDRLNGLGAIQRDA